MRRTLGLTEACISGAKMAPTYRVGAGPWIGTTIGSSRGQKTYKPWMVLKPVSFHGPARGCPVQSNINRTHTIRMLEMLLQCRQGVAELNVKTKEAIKNMTGILNVSIGSLVHVCLPGCKCGGNPAEAERTIA